jgi:hypothetical protein
MVLLKLLISMLVLVLNTTKVHQMVAMNSRLCCTYHHDGAVVDVVDCDVEEDVHCQR